MRLRHLIVPGVKAPYHAGMVAARLVLRGGARFTCLDLAYGGYARGRVYYHVDLRRCEHCFFLRRVMGAIVAAALVCYFRVLSFIGKLVKFGNVGQFWCLLCDLNVARQVSR